MGCLRRSRKRLKSTVGATTNSQTAAKMPTSEVDHGSESAISIATISAAVIQAAGSRQRRGILLAGNGTSTALTPCLPGHGDQRCRTEARQNVDQNDFAAGSLDDLVADDLLEGIVAAFDQHARPDPLDQVDRRVLLEDHDEIDRLKRRQHFRARLLILTGRPSPFSRITEASLLRPTISRSQARALRRQHLDVTGMQDIETAIGETNAQALLGASRQLLVEVAAGCDDFFFGRQRGMRQDIAPQFRGCNSRGAALADRDGGGRIRHPQRGFPIGARPQASPRARRRRYRPRPTRREP